MDQFQTAAKEFEERTRRAISLFDLGVALLLEYFSWPILRFTRYVPLTSRQLIRPLPDELHHLLAVAPDEVSAFLSDAMNEIPLATIARVAHDQPLFDAMQSIGRGLYGRRKMMLQANRMSRTISIAVTLLNCMTAVAIFRSADMLGAVTLAGGWFSAMLLTMVICRSNHHWKPRARLRGSLS